jgi:hypothetical protein
LNPNGEGMPWAVLLGALSQVVGDRHNEALLLFIDLQRRACSHVVRIDIFKDHVARLVQDMQCDRVGDFMNPIWPSLVPSSRTRR